MISPYITWIVNNPKAINNGHVGILELTSAGKFGFPIGDVGISKLLAVNF